MRLKRDAQLRLVTLAVVSGDMIEGAIIVRLLHRKDPTAVDARRDQAPLPTVEDFATEIARAALQSDTPGITYVGGADYLGSS